ncbi:MAG: alkane 1-monooxygenase [Schleiferiaceae bacterium]|nr:alkane 1-monooxygenase [Schleiferiaceae bacterium]
MRGSKYLFVYTTPLVVVISLYLGGYYSFFAVVFLFGAIPLMELFTKGSPDNLTEEDAASVLQNPLYNLLLYSLVPIQLGLMVYYIFRLQDEGISIVEKIGFTTAFGMACGVLGINAAHELGHRTAKSEQFLSKILLATTQYLHFFIEHNRGHHRYVATKDDPASARYGETIYQFWVRSISGSWISAWRLEAKRLRIKNLNAVHFQNEMLRFQIIQFSILLLLGWLFGWETVFWYLMAAGIGILMLETVNYIEHYGLERQLKNGKYERTKPVHSWNSNHPIGRLLLLELSRHSDHHYISSRPYPLLRHFDESPQMPTGYPGMMLTALVPPLWFSIMHKKIATLRKTELALG